MRPRLKVYDKNEAVKYLEFITTTVSMAECATGTLNDESAPSSRGSLNIYVAEQ